MRSTIFQHAVRPISRLVGLLALTLAATGMHVLPADRTAEAATVPDCAAAAADETSAAVLAASCGRDVLVGPSRSEYTRVLAKPDGVLVFESAVLPQRTRRADGSWAEIELALSRSADGLLRPAASVADVAFSPGGSGPLVTLKRDGHTLTMSWPRRLPPPVVSDDSATYVNVLPEVDLVVRATRTGFTHVLVVKTPAAAANPMVRKIRFALGGDVKMTSAGDGSLRAMAGGAVFAQSQRAVMWDTTPGAAQASGRSSADNTGDQARTATVATELTAAGELLLRPDPAMLTSARSAFPLYIDPDWSVAKKRWAYTTSNDSTNENSVARVGKSPGDGLVYRSFFEFSTTGNTATGSVSLKGKQIRSARVEMLLKHSSLCTPQYTYLYLTPVINSTPKASWSKMTLSTYLAAEKGNANKGDCVPNQPDLPMNFDSAELTTQLQTAATENWNTITFGFAARDSGGGGESTTTRWMKYDPAKAVLAVEYNSIPGAPTGLQVAGVACFDSGALTVGTLSPNLSAVYPDADTQQTLSGAYEWIEVPAGGMSSVTDTNPTRLAPPPIASATANGRATTTALSNVVKGKTYAYRVRATDPAPYTKTGPWSTWCQFKVDNTAPPVTVTVTAMPAGPGQPGTFTISSPATDVTKFKYGWGAPTTEVTATGSGPKIATVTLIAPKYGKHIFYVSAVDATSNEGYGSTEFIVGRPTPPIGRWGLETYPGVTQAQALADKQPGLGGDTPLTATGASWDQDVHVLGGQTLNLRGNAEAQTTGPAVLDTRQSFSVAAWIRPTDSAYAYNALFSQEGTTTSGFLVYAIENKGKWGFAMYDNDGTSTAGTFVYAPLTLNTWQHVAAVYDATARVLKIYLNGQLIQSAKRTSGASWQASGKFHVGWAKYGVGSVMSGPGQVADVQVFDRVLVPDDFTGRVASETISGNVNEPGMLEPIEVGGWDFEAAVPCYLTDAVDSCEAPNRRAEWDRWLALSRGTAIGAGNSASGNGVWFDNLYFPDPSDPNPETGTTEYGRSATKSGTGQDSEGNPITLWQNTPILRTDQSFTVSAWAKVERTNRYQAVISQDGPVNSGFFLYYAPENGGTWKFKIRGSVSATDESGTTYAVAPALNADQHWHHLTAVLDAPNRRIFLYVDGELKASQGMNTGWQPWQAGGALVVGRSLTSGTLDNWFYGGIDEVRVYQGTMTAAVAASHYESQLG